MKILLSYSKDHFDPTLPLEKHKTWGGSANILAREFYNFLSKIGDVTYSDGYDYQDHAGKSYDLFIGIERNFHKLVAVCNIGTSILIAVNMHPKERNDILNSFVEDELKDREAIAAGDLVEIDDIWDSIDMADYIFCFGNNLVYNSYIKHGVPYQKIKTFNYRLPEAPPSPTKPRETKRILYCASGIGLRKGFDIVKSLFESLGSHEFHLDIIGQPTNEHYNNKIKSFVKKHSRKVSYHGFVPAKSKKYQKLYQSNDFLVFPSLEEGQAGTVIEGMHYGLIPLITPEAGTEFAPLGYLEPALNSRHNKEIIANALMLSDEQVAGLKSKTQEFYKEMHFNVADNVLEAVTSCLNGHLYPKISIILPIYNKESSIGELVRLMDVAARTYGNVDVHIIFDGCSDDSESIVREFFKEKDTYEVKFYTTSNIFEVKTNNLGLQNSDGKYAIILQDDNYIYDSYCFFEAVQFLDKDPHAVILGGLAGVNFYPLGTENLKGPGQISINSSEVYWRQDEATDPKLKDYIFEVDACMRGPLIFRRSFLEEHGFLDEIYAPLYQDDMDICFRARKYGYKVYCVLMDVANKSLTMANYEGKKAKYFSDIMKRNGITFYERWTPSTDRDYSRINRLPILKYPLN